MSKKHFIALADAMRAIRPTDADVIGSMDKSTAESELDAHSGRVEQWRKTVTALADVCASQSAAFNRSSWLAYINGECGPNGGAR